MRQIKSCDAMFQAIGALTAHKILKTRILSRKFLQNESFFGPLSNALISVVLQD